MISKITLKGNVRVDGIQRVLDKLVKRKRNGLIKVITGVRRCGKSYLLNTIFCHHLIENGDDESHIIRFAFDSADDLSLIGENLIQIEKGKTRRRPRKIYGVYPL